MIELPQTYRMSFWLIGMILIRLGISASATPGHGRPAQ
jgi:hypothetical protein